MWGKILEKFVVYGFSGFIIVWGIGVWGIGVCWLSYHKGKARQAEQKLAEERYRLAAVVRERMSGSGQRIKGLTNREGIRVIQMPKKPGAVEPKGAEWNVSPGLRRGEKL